MIYIMNTNFASNEEWLVAVKRQASRSALTRPGRPASYYEHHRAILRELTPGSTPAAPQRMVKRTAPISRRVAAKVAQRMGRKTPAEQASAMRWVLQVCDRTEQQIRGYSPTRRLQEQRRINDLRAKAKANLRKLGYSDVR